jgi:progressive ankylosis protein
MMSVEGPFLAAVIARMVEPKFNLAAYGVAFSFALIIEAPIILIMSAATALVKEKHSFFKLRNFTYSINIIITVVMLVFLIPSIFYFVVEGLIGLPKNVADLTYIATIVLLPWPGAIGYRRFYQGILIRYNHTRKVAYGTIIRLTSMAITALGFYLFTEVPGVVVGASALSVAVIVEAIASKFMSLKIVRKIKLEETEEGRALTYSDIYQFYYPLALTSILTLGVHPMVTFFIGQSRFPLESLAVLPVINSLVFIFRSIGLSFQEVVIALMGEDKSGYKPLKKFATMLASGVFICLAIIAFTPISTFWFATVSGLTNELTQFAKVPLMIIILMPVMTVIINFQRGTLVSSKITKPITYATIMEVGGILFALFIAISFFDAVGAVAAMIAYTFGRLLANVYLIPPLKKASKN